MIMILGMVPMNAFAAIESITIVINDDSEVTEGTLEKAITASAVPIDEIYSLKITGGSVTAVDWRYIGRTLSILESFEITDSVTAVADIPAGSSGTPFFPKSIYEVIVPQSSNIGDYAFEGCTSLTRVTMGAKAIGMAAFENCAALTTLKLPATPPTVGTGAFTGCPTSRALVYVDENGADLTGDALIGAQAAYKAVTDGDTTDNLWYGWEAAPAPVVEITINVSDTAGTIGGASLEEAIGKYGLGDASIQSLKIIGGKMTAADWTYLQNLSNMTAFEIDAAVTDVADIPDAYNTTFPTLIEKVTVPQAIAIGAKAFINCQALKTVNFASATSIGNDAFSNCGALAEAAFPKASDIGERAFSACGALETADFPKAEILGVSAFSYCKALKTAEFPEATSVDAEAFRGCDALETVNFPKASEIGANAFSNCSVLETATLPWATSVGSSAFSNCTKLKTATLPAVTSIADAAFAGCTKLETLKLRPTPPTASSGAFTGCPTPRALGYVDASGTDLTDADLKGAQNAYKAANDGNIADNLWYGWEVVSVATPVITVGAQVGAATYGMAASPTFTVTGTGFGGTPPAFNPGVVWAGTAPTDITPVFSADKSTLTIETTATTPAGEYQFNVASFNNDSVRYESAKVTLTIGKATIADITGATTAPENRRQSNLPFDLSPLLPSGLLDERFAVDILENSDRVLMGAQMSRENPTVLNFGVDSVAKDKSGVIGVVVSSKNHKDFTIKITVTTVVDGPVVDLDTKTVFGNGKALIVEGTSTASTIYIDENRDGKRDAGELSLKAAGVKNAPDDGVDLSAYTLYGGSATKPVNEGGTLITLLGGKLKAVYGGEKDAAATINGNKTVQVSGKPIVTDGIDLASLTDGKVLVLGALKGAPGAIALKNPLSSNAGQVVAAAAIPEYSAFVNAVKFSLKDRELVLDKTNPNAFTVVLSGPLDVTAAVTHMTTCVEHFGDGAASYGKDWIGALLPDAGYKLPTTVTITIGGTTATPGTHYSYNTQNGEIKIDAKFVKGNVTVTADGAPITYVINYNANGGKVNDKDTDPQPVKFGDIITFPTATKPVGSEWEFLGWARKYDAVAPDFGTTTTDALSTIDTAQITLYAVWKAPNGFPTSLQNGSFEKPPVTGGFNLTFNCDSAVGIEWKTTASDRMIEIANPSLGVDAAYNAYGVREASEGLQFAELNANMVSALYQTVATNPGGKLFWGLDHRGRRGTDTMEVWIGSETQVMEAVIAYKAEGNKVGERTKAVFAKYPTMQRTDKITDNGAAWVSKAGNYSVPTGQTATMFAFVSISNPASKSTGNLLDNVYFSTVEPPERKGITIRAGQGGRVWVSGAEGFTVVTPTTPYQKRIELGQMLQATVMTNAGYTFNGGYVDGKYFTKKALLTELDDLRLTMTANTPNEITILFAKDSTITFEPNGGVSAFNEKTLVADTASTDNKYQIDTPAKETYSFDGWLVAGTDKTLNASDLVQYLTAEEDGKTTLASGAKVAVPTDDGMILIAQWTEAEPTLVTTTLTLAENGGKYGEYVSYDGESIFEEWPTQYELDASFGGTNALVLKAPVRDGYVFTEWKDLKNVYTTNLKEGDKLTYTIKEKTGYLTVGGNAETLAPETLTLTAQWEKLPDAPVFATQPENKELTYGYTGNNDLMVSANATAGETLSYQWYSNTTNSNQGGTAIEGATGATYTVPTGKTVGDYYYYCVVTATDAKNHKTSAASNAATVTVKKATLTATYAGETIAFGETPVLAITVTGFVNGETAETATNYAAPTLTNGNTAVGNYTLTPSGGAADNYTFTYTGGTLTISADGVSATGYTGEYDGKPHGITVSLSGAAAGATITYGTSAEECTQTALPYTNAGTYTVYYKVSKLGYAEVTGWQIITIRPKEVTLTWSGYENLVYDGKAKNVTATAGGLVSGDSCTVTVSGGTQTRPNSYTATATGLSNPNYKLPAAVTRDYTITYDKPGGGSEDREDRGEQTIPKLNKEDHFAYMVGDHEGNFRPDTHITRAESAMVFYNLLLNKPTSTGREHFSDVPKGAWYEAAVETLAELSIVSGYVDGTFRPDSPITRAEFAAMASRFDSLTAGGKDFPDVPVSHWAYREITSAAAKGWINGYPDSTFRPEQSITRAEVTVLVNAALGRVPDKTYLSGDKDRKIFPDLLASHWAYYSIGEACNSHKYTKPANGAETWVSLFTK